MTALEDMVNLPIHVEKLWAMVNTKNGKLI